MAYSKKDSFAQSDIEVSELCKALAHPARVAILKVLLKKQTCICNDIVEELPLSQSTVSQHLKALKTAGLIKGEIDGPRVCYCINHKVLSKALNNLFTFMEETQKPAACAC